MNIPNPLGLQRFPNPSLHSYKELDNLWSGIPRSIYAPAVQNINRQLVHNLFCLCKTRQSLGPSYFCEYDNLSLQNLHRIFLQQVLQPLVSCVYLHIILQLQLGVQYIVMTLLFCESDFHKHFFALLTKFVTLKNLALWWLHNQLVLWLTQ